MDFSRPFQIADCRIDPACNEVSGPCGRTALQPRIMRVLVRLAMDAGRPVDREALLEYGWSEAPYVADEALTRAVSSLRAALAQCDPGRSLIRTVPKFGYMLTGPVSSVRGSMPPRPGRPAGRRRPRKALAAVAGFALLVLLHGFGLLPVEARLQMQRQAVTGERPDTTFSVHVYAIPKKAVSAAPAG